IDLLEQTLIVGFVEHGFDSPEKCDRQKTKCLAGESTVSGGGRPVREEDFPSPLRLTGCFLAHKEENGGNRSFLVYMVPMTDTCGPCWAVSTVSNRTASSWPNMLK